jgi:Domain of unknown function (DUF4124)
MPRKLPMLLLAGLALAALASGIYKWVDEKGVTHYSDAPPPTQKAQELPMPSAPPRVPLAAQPAGKNWPEQELGFRKRHAERTEAAQREEQQQAAARFDAALRKERCLLARQNLQVLQVQRAVYFINEKGEREFLDDERRAAEIERVKAQIATDCVSQ